MLFSQSIAEWGYDLFIAQPRSLPPGMMNWLKLLSEVRKHDRRAKFLVVSGGPKTHVEESIKDLSLGDYTYLDLPCTRDQLLKAVDRALADRHELAA